MIRLSGSVKLSGASSGGTPKSRANGVVPRLVRPSAGVRPFCRSSSACRASSRAFAAAMVASRSSRRCRAAGSSSPRTSGPSVASSAASLAAACAVSAAIGSRSRASSSRIRPSLLAVCLLAWALTFVPSTASAPSGTTPASRAIGTTCTNSASNAATCCGRNSAIVRCAGKLPAANPRYATSSSRFRAIRRDENVPVAYAYHSTVTIICGSNGRLRRPSPSSGA